MSRWWRKPRKTASTRRRSRGTARWSTSTITPSSTPPKVASPRSTSGFPGARRVGPSPQSSRTWPTATGTNSPSENAISTAARSPLDPALQAALELTDETVGTIDPESAMSDLLACPWFEIDGRIIRTLVLAARFDSALDVTVDELRIELIYPLDDEADAFFRSASPRRSRTER